MKKPKEIALGKLESWTKSPDPEIRYFSGTADYEIDLSLPKNISSLKDSIIIKLGDLRETAKVTLNDSLLGYAWFPDYSFYVTGLLKDGNNKLNVSVANVYRNRIIGDLVQYGKVQNVWTTSPVNQFLNKNMPLKASGLMGPIRLIKLKPIEIKMD